MTPDLSIDPILKALPVVDGYKVLVPNGETLTFDLLFSHDQGNIDALIFDAGLECTNVDPRPKFVMKTSRKYSTSPPVRLITLVKPLRCKMLAAVLERAPPAQVTAMAWPRCRSSSSRREAMVLKFM